MCKKEENELKQLKFMYGLFVLQQPDMDERCPIETGFIVGVKKNCMNKSRPFPSLFC